MGTPTEVAKDPEVIRVSLGIGEHAGEPNAASPADAARPALLRAEGGLGHSSPIHLRGRGSAA
jgi:hypothetical protein